MSTAELPVQMFHAGRKKGGIKNDASFLMRLPQEMKTHLLMCAAINCRSANEEVLSRIRESVDGESIDEHGVIVRHTAQAVK